MTPINNEQVKFYFGTQSDYLGIVEKDPSGFYIITDNHRIYIGDELYSNVLQSLNE